MRRISSRMSSRDFASCLSNPCCCLAQCKGRPGRCFCASCLPAAEVSIGTVLSRKSDTVDDECDSSAIVCRMLALPLVRLRSSQDLTLESNVSLLLQTVAHCLQPGVPADVQCCAATVGNTHKYVHTSQCLYCPQAWPVAAAFSELCNR